MAAFDPFIRTVSDMMRRFGGNGVLEVTKGGVYNPETSSVEPQVIEYAMRAMIFDYVPRMDGAGVENKSLIRNGDKQMFVKTDPELPAPEANDRITFGGITYAVIVAKELNPSGSAPIYYELYLRE